jgi:hypothetical protein
VGGGGVACADEGGASRFGPGRGRPWGRVARGFIGSKVKVSEWRNFGVEWLLGAANGDEPQQEFGGIKRQAAKGEEGAKRRETLAQDSRMRRTRERKRRPTCNPDTWGTQILRTYVWATRPATRPISSHVPVPGCPRFPVGVVLALPRAGRKPRQRSQISCGGEPIAITAK